MRILWKITGGKSTNYLRKWAAKLFQAIQDKEVLAGTVLVFFLLGQKPIEWKMVGLGGVIYTHLVAIYFPRLAQAAVLQVCEGIPLQPTRPAPRNLTFASLFWTKGRLRFRGLLATLHHHKLQRWWRTATSRRERKSWGIILVKRRSKRYLYQKGIIWMDCWIDWS